MYPALKYLTSSPIVFFLSLEEIERIYEIAISGSDYEKISAAKVLCGTSLFRSWSVQVLNRKLLLSIVRFLSYFLLYLARHFWVYPSVLQLLLQEHILLFIVELLSTPGTTFQLIDYAQFLNVLLVGILSMECVQTFSLHGLVWLV